MQEVSNSIGTQIASGTGIGKQEVRGSHMAVLPKLRRSSILRISFSPLYFAPPVRMAQTVTTHASLGLTKPASIAISQIAYSAKETDF
ncbi:hypothetical protein CKAN_02030900 [Cinnamomum micranthum f. kanehirae]|uniref:Uncharacterized protein n=1 Tax=Cinnamomum micranthum f. kanehirae TaxID=337451 RepID=A0A443PK89_9MAGN|nr:hypothetical protein CKAN_02030900 [Cinnamomum micranthum f. kanehirae]